MFDPLLLPVINYLPMLVPHLGFNSFFHVNLFFYFFSQFWSYSFFSCFVATSNAVSRSMILLFRFFFGLFFLTLIGLLAFILLFSALPSRAFPLILLFFEGYFYDSFFPLHFVEFELQVPGFIYCFFFAFRFLPLLVCFSEFVVQHLVFRL